MKLFFNIEHVREMIGFSPNLTSGLEFKPENIIALCGRALAPLWFLSARTRISLWSCLGKQLN